jgi:hypothetical protein
MVWAKSHPIALIILVILAQGWVRLAFVPLWAHYDEPSHYEALRSVTLYNKMPAAGEMDAAIFTEIAATYGNHPVERCDEPPTNDTICLRPGQQSDEMPLYYWFQALPQRLLSLESVWQRAALARMLSILLACAVALMAYASARLAFPHQSLLHIGTPLLMGMITGYVDLMSAINNDVGAVAAVTFVVFAVTRLLTQKPTARGWVMAAIAALLCLFMKPTAWVALPVWLAASIMVVWPRLSRSQRIMLILGLVAVCLAVFVWNPRVGPLVRPQLDALLPKQINPLLRQLYRVNDRWPEYLPVLIWQFATFWSGFANGVAGFNSLQLVMLALVSVGSGLGLVYWMVREGHAHWRVTIVYFLCVAAALSTSLLRYDPPEGANYVPSARYFYVAIVPTVLLWLLGILAWLPRSMRRYALALLIFLLHQLGVWSLLLVQIPWFRSEWPIGY